MAKTAKHPVDQAPDNDPLRGITDEHIDAACEILLRWVASISQQYRDNIQIAKSENGWDARTMFGAWVGYIIENDLHLQVPTNPFFEPRFSGDVGGRVNCIRCNKKFLIAWPGQETCSNECCNIVKEARRLIAEQRATQEAKTPL